MAKKEVILCDWCGTWVATHTTQNGYAACDKPRCQDGLARLAVNPVVKKIAIEEHRKREQAREQKKGQSA